MDFDLLKMRAIGWYVLLAAAMEGGVFQPKRSSVDKKPRGIISRKKVEREKYQNKYVENALLTKWSFPISFLFLDPGDWLKGSTWGNIARIANADQCHS